MQSGWLYIPRDLFDGSTVLCTACHSLPCHCFPVMTAMLSLQYGDMHMHRACTVELVWLPVSDTFDVLIMQGMFGTAV